MLLPTACRPLCLASDPTDGPGGRLASIAVTLRQSYQDAEPRR